MITMVMLSGGIDSVYVLYRLLRDTDDVVHAHHVHILTDFNRHIPEAVRCHKIVEYCRKNVRDFTYSETTIDHRGFQCHGYDLAAAGFEAGMVASSYTMATKKNIDRWTIGYAGDDEIPPRRIKHAINCCKANCQNDEPPALVIFPRVDVKIQAAYLPLELFNLTWSCRSPANVGDNIMPCGKCKACLRRASVAHVHADLDDELTLPDMRAVANAAQFISPLELHGQQ